jgi:hypothetical protein
MHLAAVETGSQQAPPEQPGTNHVTPLAKPAMNRVAKAQVTPMRVGDGAAQQIIETGILKTAGHTSIAAACRHHARDATRTLETLGLRPA